MLCTNPAAFIWSVRVKRAVILSAMINSGSNSLAVHLFIYLFIVKNDLQQVSSCGVILSVYYSISGIFQRSN